MRDTAYGNEWLAKASRVQRVTYILLSFFQRICGNPNLHVSFCIIRAVILSHCCIYLGSGGKYRWQGYGRGEVWIVFAKWKQKQWYSQLRMNERMNVWMVLGMLFKLAVRVTAALVPISTPRIIKYLSTEEYWHPLFKP